jgi:hypothetical protein
MHINKLAYLYNSNGSIVNKSMIEVLDNTLSLIDKRTLADLSLKK